jgi:ParB/RepB/Spo0J family partition protein
MPLLELVAGECRWRSSEIAGATDLPTLVKALTDLEVLEIQLVENMQRADLHPLEEAEGMRRLLDATEKAGKPLAAEGLAIMLGKSTRWVFLRLELLNLCDEAREAFLDDVINASVAGLIARMPNVDQQREATARILTGFNGEPFTFRAAAEYLRKEFMLDLARATFNIDAAYKVDGPCHRCDKRSGSKPDLFDDVKVGDLCQDSKCFAAKGEEAHEQLLQQCRDAGHQVLQGDNARRLMPSSATPSGYFLAKDPCVTLTADKRSLFDLFGDKQKGFVTVELTGSRSLVTLVPEAVARKLLKAKNLLRAAAPTPAPVAAPAPAARAATPPPQAAPAPQADTAQPKLKPQPLSPAQLAHAIELRAGVLFSHQLFNALAGALVAADEPPLLVLQNLVKGCLVSLSAQAHDLLRRTPHCPNIPATHALPSGPDKHAVVADYLRGMNGRDLADLLALVQVAEELSNEDCLATLDAYSTVATPLASAFGIDMAALQRHADAYAAEQVEAEEEARLGKVSAGDAFAATHGEAVHE